MSRAFVGEHDSWGDPGYRVSLPPRDDPAFDAAAAEALLEAARAGQTGSAEMATGYYWGEPKLNPHVRGSLETARAAKDERVVELCERYLQI
ncbi:MAG: hypothetical protein B7Z72_11205 [Gemmatimonadetes bacterium 21-71-4]|nr:MAG: hypothetical protein B7Z72_11205 [Gemmatimonadetes bacterium 21-71-4]